MAAVEDERTTYAKRGTPKVTQREAVPNSRSPHVCCLWDFLLAEEGLCLPDVDAPPAIL
jgi:hypothetical protein